MPKELHESGQIKLHESGGKRCVYTGEEIGDSAHVRVKFPTLGDHEWLPEEDVIHIDVSAVDGLIAELDNGPRTIEGGELEWVAHDGSSRRTYECPVCVSDEYEPNMHLGVENTWDSNGNPHVTSIESLWLHRGCVSGFCDALDRVWEYSDELLADRV